MDKFFTRNSDKYTGTKRWGALLLTAVSGVMLLQTPIIHANSLVVHEDRLISQSQQVTFYVQPQYQSDQDKSWQDVPGSESIKIAGIPGQPFEVPTLKNFVPEREMGTVPTTHTDSAHPLKLKYLKHSTGLYTATVNIDYVKHKGYTIDTDTKTLHYADSVTIFPKQVAGYKLFDIELPNQYFHKNPDQSVSFTFKELRDPT